MVLSRLAAAAVLLVALGTAAGCDGDDEGNKPKTPRTCPPGLVEYNGDCTTSVLIAFANCIKGHGLTVIDTVEIKDAATYRLVMSNSIQFARSRTVKEDQLFSLGVIKSCNELTLASVPKGDPIKTAAELATPEINKAIKDAEDNVPPLPPPPPPATTAPPTTKAAAPTAQAVWIPPSGTAEWTLHTYDALMVGPPHQLKAGQGYGDLLFQADYEQLSWRDWWTDSLDLSLAGCRAPGAQRWQALKLSAIDPPRTYCAVWGSDVLYVQITARDMSPPADADKYVKLKVWKVAG